MNFWVLARPDRLCSKVHVGDAYALVAELARDDQPRLSIQVALFRREIFSTGTAGDW